MVSSHRTTVEPWAHSELSEAEPNDNPLDSNSSNHEDSDPDCAIFQTGQSKQQSRTKSVVHSS